MKILLLTVWTSTWQKHQHFQNLNSINIIGQKANIVLLLCLTPKLSCFFIFLVLLLQTMYEIYPVVGPGYRWLYFVGVISFIHWDSFWKIIIKRIKKQWSIISILYFKIKLYNFCFNWRLIISELKYTFYCLLILSNICPVL